MDDWKTTFLLGRPILKGYVSFREGNVQKRTCFCGFVESEELQRPWIPYGFPCYPCDSVGRSGQMCHPRCLTHWRVLKYGFWILRISLYTKQINSIISHQKNQESRVIQISRTWFFWGTSTASAKCQLRWKINTSDHAEPAGPNQNEQTTSSQHVSFQTSTFHSTCIYKLCIMMNNDEQWWKE